MEDTSGTAQLGGEADAQGVVTTISRAQVEDALRSDEPVDLLLDIERVEDGRSEKDRLALGWERADLEQLLASTSGEEISLSFDPEELQRLLDQDVEAHGLREKFAVVTAVAGLAAAGAGPASAALIEGTGGAAPPAAAAQQVTPAEITTGLGTAAETTAAPATASEISTGLGPTATEAEASPARTSEISTGLTPATPSSPARTSEISAGLAPSTPSLVSVRVAPAPTRASEISTGLRPGPAAVESGGGSGTSVSWPSPAEAALAGGLLLAITAATFVARSQRRPPATT